MQLGKMYLVKELFWLLFPTKEVAEAWWERGGQRSERSWAYQEAKKCSERFKCNVAVVEENTYFVLLEQDKFYIKLLDSNGNIGWISFCFWNFSKHFEVLNETNNNL